MFENILIAFVKLNRAIANAFSYELAITINEHTIELDYVDPDAIDEKAFDDNHFVSGNIFLSNYANPIRPSKISEAVDQQEFISSDRYQTYMEQSLIDDVVQSSKDKTITLLQAVAIIVTMQIISFVLYMVV